LPGSNRNLENYELVKRKLEELPEEQLKPAPLVTGADLIAEGYEPGPRFAEMLAAVEDAQLEGRIGSREEAMAMVREMFPPAATMKRLPLRCRSPAN
jgi:poly(A) polymerase